MRNASRARRTMAAFGLVFGASFNAGLFAQEEVVEETPAVAAAAAQAPAAFDPATAAATSANYISISKEFAGAQRVLIPTFRVVFSTKARGSASASRLMASGTANVHGSYSLRGVDDAQFQAITDAVYKRFVDTLKAKGVEVLAFDQIPEPFKTRMLEKSKPAPARFDYLKRSYAVFTPAGLPFYAGLGEPVQEAYGFGGKLSNIGFAAAEYVEGDIAGETQSTVLRPTFWIEFIDIESSGNMFSGRASVSGEPGLKITQAQTSMRVIPHTLLQKQRRGMEDMGWVPADWNFLNLPALGLKQNLQPADSGVLSVTNATDTATAVVQTALNVVGMFAGVGGRKDVAYDVVVDPVRYTASSEQSMGAVAEMWASAVAGK